MVFDTRICDMLNGRIYGQIPCFGCIIYIMKGEKENEKNQKKY